jgi:hypothetical protein
MRTHLVIAALLLTACGTDHQNPELTYRFRANCSGNQETIRRAAALWVEAGIDIRESPDADIVVCAAKAGAFGGLSNLETGGMLVNTSVDGAVGIAAKHFGFALMGYHDSLPRGVVGVMATEYLDTRAEFTVADFEFLRANDVLISY